MAPSLSRKAVKVVFLGALRHALGLKELEIDVEGGMTGRELMDAIEERVPGFTRIISELKRRGIGILVVRDGLAVGENDELKPGDTVYVMPPTSGGFSPLL